MCQYLLIARQCVLLLFAALLCLLLPAVNGRPGRNRKEMIAMVGDKEDRLYFNSCNQINQAATCVFAIDNGKSREFSQCAVTLPELNPWWIGELETPSYVTKVTLTGLLPNYLYGQDGMLNFKLLANRDVCIEYHIYQPLGTETFGCDAFADKIHIVSKGNSVALGICDVEVFGVTLQFPTIDKEASILKFKRCRQSSDFSYCDFALAPVTELRCAYTDREVQPWMEFYLEYPAFIDRVTLYHRRQELAPKEYTVDVDDEICFHRKYSPENYSTQSHYCDSMFGVRVKIQSWLNPPDGYLFESALQICKIEVSGFPAKISELDTFTPLGCYKDELKDPDMPTLVSFNRMDLSKCYRICKRLKYKYFGVKFGKQCFCGNTYGKHGKDTSEPSLCAEPCEVNKAQTCGGISAMNVFEIGGMGDTPDDPAEAGSDAKTATDSEIAALPDDSPTSVAGVNGTSKANSTNTAATTTVAPKTIVGDDTGTKTATD